LELKYILYKDQRFQDATAEDEEEGGMMDADE